MTATKNVRNGWIDLWRFVAALCIISVHIPYATRQLPFGAEDTLLFPNAHLYVEFFFALSGYYAVAHVSKWSAHESPEPKIGVYVGKKYLYFLSFAAPYAVLEYVSNIAWNDIYGVDAVKTLLAMPTEALLLQDTGMAPYRVAGVLWYLSALLLALPILLYLATRFRPVFQAYLVWVLPPVCYGILLHVNGNFGVIELWMAVVRALGGLCLGAALFYATQYLRRYTFTGVARVLMTLAEVGGMLLAFALAATDYIPQESRDVGFVLLVAVSLGITFLQQSGTSRLHGRVLRYLGKLSFPIYVWHPLVLEQVENIGTPLGWQPWQRLLGIYVFSILFAGFMLWFVERIYPCIGRFCKKVFIQTGAE